MAGCIFPCGHINYPKHQRGGRFIPCRICGKWAGVDAKPVEVIEYVATPTDYTPPPQPRFEDG